MKTLRTLGTAAAMSLLLALPALAADHIVVIKGMKYDPPLIEVAVGDTITFTNEDAAPHTATATDGSFDTGRLNRGESATVTIEGVGTFDYICTVHPMMKAQVVAN